MLLGSALRGISVISGASGGNGSQDSPANHTVVQLRRLDNGQSDFLLPDGSAGVSDSAFASAPVTPLPPVHALVTVFANGIPGVSALVTPPLPAIAVEHPPGTGLADGTASIAIGTAILGGSVSIHQHQHG